jgi:hypothetical protein
MTLPGLGRAGGGLQDLLRTGAGGWDWQKARPSHGSVVTRGLSRSGCRKETG